MLGEMIGEGRGKRTGRRVIATDPQFKVEVSFEDSSTLMGVAGMNIGTYVSQPKPDGNLHGTGEGVFATVEGEMVTWQGVGVGSLGEGGKVSYSGCLSYTTASKKLAKLNGIAVVFEFEVDAQGNTQSKAWAWTCGASMSSAA